MSFTEAVADEIHARANGWCEACGGRLGADGGVFHHRLLRTHGGKDEAANVIEIHWVCHNGHTNSIHSRVERSYRLGHLVRLGTDPATVPVTVCADLLRLTA